MIKYANEIKRTHSLLNVLATTRGNSFRITIFKLRNLFKQTQVFGLKNSNKIMTKVVNFTQQKIDFINSYDPNKQEIQRNNRSLVKTFILLFLLLRLFFCKRLSAKRVCTSPPCKRVFFATIAQNITKFHLYM
jgi:hypothetical protein